MTSAGIDFTPPLGLYVHWPWCVRKCPYCDFNSHRAPETIDQDRYLKALIADLTKQSRALEDAQSRPIESIFLGGGTPSLFSADSIEGFLTAVHRVLAVADDVEITMEANPGTLEHDDFAAYCQAGINRLSLGIQSFDDETLVALGRIHGGREALTAAESASQAGFSRLNLDLMFGLPGQQVEGALDDIQSALAVDPGHISHYQLTLEPNTLFAAHPPKLPDEDEIAAIQEACGNRLGAAGYHHYEISAWGREGHACRHNLNYWRFGDYLGVGAGAHGKLTRGDGIWRYARQRHPQAYMAAPTEDQSLRKLSDDDLIFEYFLNVLRLSEPVDLQDFDLRTGVPRAMLREPLAGLSRQGLIAQGEEGFSLTELGGRFLNDVMGAFLPGGGR